MATIMENNSAFNTRVLFNLKDLGINKKFLRSAHTTMTSKKYICVRESGSVVIIDMSKPKQLIRLPITADYSAIMNPDTPILAFIVQAKIDETTRDQVEIFDVEAKTTLKSYTIDEKVMRLKWITPKILAVITLKAIYHWSIEGSTGPVKISDMTELTTHKNIYIWDYIHDPYEKWIALIISWKDAGFETHLFFRPYRGGEQWLSFIAHAAAFTNLNVEENHTPSTLFCYALGLESKGLEFCVSDTLVAKPGEPGFGKKRSIVSSDRPVCPIKLQISQKYGLIYVITQQSQIFIQDLETAQAICSYNVSDQEIFRVIEGPSSGSFYSINNEGQVLLTNVNDWTILSFVSNKLINRGNLYHLRKLCLQMLEEKEDIVTNLERSLQDETKKKEEAEEQLSSMSKEIHNSQVSRKQMLSENIKLTKEKDKIIENLTKSLQVEREARREIEEQLKSKMIEIYNYQQSQKEMLNKIDDFRLFQESNNLEANFIEYSYAELRKVTNDFNDSLKIGEGGYGPVYKAFIGLKPVAIKILKHESSHGNKQFSQEVDILSRVRHQNLVMLFGACQEAQALIYELLPNGSLYDILRNEKTRNALTSKIRICIASNICSALIVLHSEKPHGIVHGDLKSANILLDSNYVAKLSDFGICRNLEKTDSRNTAHHYTDFLKGTPAYWDPELFNAGEMTVQCDVYAFGIILLELVTGRDPRGLKDQVEEALNKGGNLIVDPSAGEWPLAEAKKMIQLGLRCSELSRKKRPNLEKEVCPEIESMLRASLPF